MPQEKLNWDTSAVFLDNRYHTREKWQDKRSGRVPHLTALGITLQPITQPFRAGLMFGPGPPGLDDYRFAHPAPGRPRTIESHVWPTSLRALTDHQVGHWMATHT
jgi:hypothetical protein